MCSYDETAKRKAGKTAAGLFAGGVLAGAFIAFGALCSQIAGAEAGGRMASAAVFPIGLTMVVLAGAELFTGNCLMAAGVLSRAVAPGQVARNWCIAYLGNLAGSLIVAAMAVACGTGTLLGGAVADGMIAAAEAKASMAPGAVLAKSILCNVLVCTAVWNATKAKETAGKALAAYLPTFAFVLCGFEHSIANMYFIPAGMMAQSAMGVPSTVPAAGAIMNILVATAGNIIGGAVLAAGGLWASEQGWAGQGR